MHESPSPCVSGTIPLSISIPAPPLTERGFTRILSRSRATSEVKNLRVERVGSRALTRAPDHFADLQSSPFKIIDYKLGRAKLAWALEKLGMNDASRTQGWAICIGTGVLALMFVIGVLNGSYMAIAIPVTVLTLFVLGLTAWVGYTIATIQVQAEPVPEMDEELPTPSDAASETN